MIAAYLLLAAASVSSQITSTNGTFFKHLIKKQHIRHCSDYKQRRDELQATSDELHASMLRLQSAGHVLPCSYQIASDVTHYIHYTDNFTAAQQRLTDLNRSLMHLNQSQHDRQQPDGSWAGCTNLLFQKLALSQDQLYPYFLSNRSLPFPLRFFQSSVLNSSTTLIPYLDSLLTSDISSTGTNNRQELNAVLTFVSKLVSMRPWVNAANHTGLHLSEEYVDAYFGFLRRVQDPAYGFWGARYWENGTLYASLDLSITFHVTKYWLSNATPAVLRLPPPSFSNLGAIASTALLLKNEMYPYGWGLSTDPVTNTTVFDNHNDFDVVTLIALGWSTLSPAAKAEASSDIGQMLHWALGPDSLKRNASAASLVCDGADSVGDCYYFFVAFLKVIGYWAPTRFWTDHDFDDLQLCVQLKRTYLQFPADPNSGIAWSARLLLDEFC